MITEDRISAFIRSLERPGNLSLEEIRKEAIEDGVPVIRPETGQLLSFFAGLMKAEKVLEVGTAVGYSALLLLEVLPENAVITTIENYPPRIAKAKENFLKAGAGERIRLLEGDAAEILPGLSGGYDMIFMDAAKAQYIHWLPEVKRLLRTGGLLLSDNILQDGSLLESRYAVERRDRTIHKRMRSYLEALTSDPELSTVLFPLGDGVAATFKKS